jgi:tRNA pseudouridine55 synthase
MQSGSHLTALRRTKIGDYKVENALTPEEFEKVILNSEVTE